MAQGQIVYQGMSVQLFSMNNATLLFPEPLNMAFRAFFMSNFAQRQTPVATFPRSWNQNNKPEVPELHEQALPNLTCPSSNDLEQAA